MITVAKTFLRYSLAKLILWAWLFLGLVVGLEDEDLSTRVEMARIRALDRARDHWNAEAARLAARGSPKARIIYRRAQEADTERTRVLARAEIIVKGS